MIVESLHTLQTCTWQLHSSTFVNLKYQKHEKNLTRCMASTQALIMLSFAASHDSTLITATSSCATSHPVLHYCVYSIQSAG